MKEYDNVAKDQLFLRISELFEFLGMIHRGSSQKWHLQPLTGEQPVCLVARREISVLKRSVNKKLPAVRGFPWINIVMMMMMMVVVVVVVNGEW